MSYDPSGDSQGGYKQYGSGGGGYQNGILSLKHFHELFIT